MRFSMTSFAPLSEIQTKCSCCFPAMSETSGRISLAQTILIVSLNRCLRASSKAERIYAALANPMPGTLRRWFKESPSLCSWIRPATRRAIVLTSTPAVPIPRMAMTSSSSVRAFGPFSRNFSRGRVCSGISLMVFTLGVLYLFFGIKSDVISGAHES